MSAKKTGYPSEKGQVLRQLQNLSNASVPDTVLQGIAHYESTAGDTEKLFNSFTTQIAQIKAQLNNFRDGLNTVQVMQRENEETTRDFVQQFADLIVDYAIQKGVRVDFSSISEKEAKVLQVIHDLTVDMEKLTIVTKKLNAYSEELEKEDEAAKAAEAEVAGLGKVAPVSTSVKAALPNILHDVTPKTTLATSQVDHKPSDDEFEDSDEYQPATRALGTQRPINAPTPSKFVAKAADPMIADVEEPVNHDAVTAIAVGASEMSEVHKFTPEEQLEAAQGFAISATRGGKKSRSRGGRPSSRPGLPPASINSPVTTKFSRQPFQPDPNFACTAAQFTSAGGNPLHSALSSATFARAPTVSVAPFVRADSAQENGLLSPRSVAGKNNTTTTAAASAKPARGRGLADSKWAPENFDTVQGISRARRSSPFSHFRAKPYDSLDLSEPRR